LLNSELKQQDLYRSLDYLSDIKEELEDHLLKKSLNLFNRDIKVALYDVTTLYFESKAEDDDIVEDTKDSHSDNSDNSNCNCSNSSIGNNSSGSGNDDNDFKNNNNCNNDNKTIKGLRQFGLSKDFKINDTQIVLSLLLDTEGIPILNQTTA
jgi:transposase